MEQSLQRSTQPPLALQREGRGDQSAGGGEKNKFLHGILLLPVASRQARAAAPDDRFTRWLADVTSAQSVRGGSERLSRLAAGFKFDGMPTRRGRAPSAFRGNDGHVGQRLHAPSLTYVTFAGWI